MGLDKKVTTKNFKFCEYISLSGNFGLGAGNHPEVAGGGEEAGGGDKYLHTCG